MNPNAIVFLVAVFVTQAVSLGQQDGSAVSQSDATPQATADPSESLEINDAREKSKERLDILKQAAATYDVCVGRSRDTRAVLRPEPLLRWTNEIHYSLDGATFLWTVDGRPLVIACMYSTTDVEDFVMLDHEFQSLATGRINACRRGKVVWFPDKPGLAMKPFPNAPAPAGTATLRLVQMRRLASRLTAIAFARRLGGKDQWRLRLMPQPLHRYGDGDTAAIDGGLFVFTHGTDPDVVVVFEASNGESGPMWNYGLARMCSLPLQVRLGEQVIWDAPLVPAAAPPNPTETYVTFYRNPIAD